MSMDNAKDLIFGFPSTLVRLFGFLPLLVDVVSGPTTSKLERKCESLSRGADRSARSYIGASIAEIQKADDVLIFLDKGGGDVEENGHIKILADPAVPNHFLLEILDGDVDLLRPCGCRAGVAERSDKASWTGDQHACPASDSCGEARLLAALAEVSAHVNIFRLEVSEPRECGRVLWPIRTGEPWERGRDGRALRRVIRQDIIEVKSPSGGDRAGTTHMHRVRPSAVRLSGRQERTACDRCGAPPHTL
jgi:hypothetical protein